VSAPTFVAFARSLGVRLTAGQRVLALVAFDGVEPGSLRGKERELARELFGDVDTIPREARAVLCGVIGARSGKSFIFEGLYSLWRALAANLSGLAPGERASSLVVAPDVRLARQTLRYALGAADAAPSVARLVESRTEDSFVLRRPDGARVAVECLPATRGGSALRGRSLVSAVLSEPAFFRDESGAVNAPDIFRAVAPRVLDGGMVVMVGTPWAEGGLLHDEFVRNHGHPVTAIAAHAPTTTMRDDLRTKALVLRERLRDAENARREFDAEFLGAGSGLFFDGASIRASVDAELAEQTARGAGWTAFAGADLGLVRDASALVIVHRTGTGPGLYQFRIAEWLELRPRSGSPLDLATVLAEFGAVAKRHGVSRIVADAHLLVVANRMLPAGVYFEQAPGGQSGKVEAHARARDLFRAGVVRMPLSAIRLREQLSQITSTPTSGGGLSLRSPRRGGVHGDLASAAVLALHAASAGYQSLPAEAWREAAEMSAAAPRPVNPVPATLASAHDSGGPRLHMRADDHERAREAEDARGRGTDSYGGMVGWG
jgi:hypothetical protein